MFLGAVFDTFSFSLLMSLCLQICNVVAVAGLLNATLVIPRFDLQYLERSKACINLLYYINQLVVQKCIELAIICALSTVYSLPLFDTLSALRKGPVGLQPTALKARKGLKYYPHPTST